MREKGGGGEGKRREGERSKTALFLEWGKPQKCVPLPVSLTSDHAV